MGSQESKDLTSETTGNINNNLIISENTENYYYHSELLLLIIAVLKFLEFAYLIYANYNRKLKKKYTTSTA